MNGQKITFELDFINDGTGIVQCSEPLKYDAATFSVEQDKGRIGRDVTIGNEEISLQFWKGEFEASNEATEYPDGTTFFYKSMCFPFLLDYFNNYGSEATVMFRVLNHGVPFVLGRLDFEMATTDGRNYFECKVIQETERAAIKMDEDTKIDLYGDKDVNGNPIDPLVPVNILIEPLPIYGTSSWKYGLGEPKFFTLDDKFNFSNQQIKSEIRSSLSFIQGAGEANSFPYIQAADELTNVVITIDNIDVKFNPDNISVGTVKIIANVYTQPDSNVLPFPPVADMVYNTTVDSTISQPEDFAPSYTINIPLILRGQRLGIYFDIDGAASMIYTSADFTITATGTAIPSVVKALPYIAPYEQAVKSINGQSVTAPRWQPGGQHADIYVVNGTGMRGFANKPFYVTWKDLAENLAMFHADYQTTPFTVYIGKYADYYPDREIARFTQVPDRDFEQGVNPRLVPTRLFEIEYENYAKESDNSLTNIHTAIQLKSPNLNAKNKWQIKIPFIFDPVLIEQERRKSVSTDATTASDSDEKIFGFVTVKLPSDSRRAFTANLQHRVNDDGDFELLNYTVDQYSTSDPSFQWDSLGMSVGGIVHITIDGVTEDFTISVITPQVLTLSGAIAVSDGSDIITIDYPLDNVSLVNKTNQGFEPFIGIPDMYGNVDFSLKRIATEQYGGLLAEIGQVQTEEIFRCMYYKNLSETENVITQRVGENPVTEFADIAVADLGDAVLSPFTLSSRVVVTFEQAMALFEAINTIYPDNTIGGYITVLDSRNVERKVYLTKGGYLLVSGTLDLDGEVKKEEPEIELIDMVPVPSNTYTLESLPGDLEGFFNKPIQKATGNLYIYKEGVLFFTVNQDDILLIEENSFLVDIGDVIVENGNYSVRIDAGLFFSGAFIYGGIDNDTDWAFTVSDGL